MKIWAAALSLAFAASSSASAAPIVLPVHAVAIENHIALHDFEWSHAVDTDPSADAQSAGHTTYAHAVALSLGLLFVNAGGAIVALDRLSGTQIWSTHGTSFGVPVVSGDAVAAAASDGTIHVFDAARGRERWHADSRTSLPPAPAHMFVPPTVVHALNDGFFVGAARNGRVRASE